MLCSLAFPVLSGTSLRDEISGVFVRPLTLPNVFNVPAQVHPNWLIIVLTVVGVFAAVAFRSLSPESIRGQSTWTHVVLAGVGLWLLGLGTMVFARMGRGGMAARHRAPSCARCSARSPRAEPTGPALGRAVGHVADPRRVPGGGLAGGLGHGRDGGPCVIALAAGLDHSRIWRESPGLMRVRRDRHGLPRAHRRSQCVADHRLEETKIPEIFEIRGAGNRPDAS